MLREVSIYAILKRLTYLSTNWASGHHKAKVRAARRGPGQSDSDVSTLCKYLCKAVAWQMNIDSGILPPNDGTVAYVPPVQEEEEQPDGTVILRPVHQTQPYPAVA